jgi:nitrite reductase/ring-hydroxylating ferredoxin subunit
MSMTVRVKQLAEPESPGVDTGSRHLPEANVHRSSLRSGGEDILREQETTMNQAWTEVGREDDFNSGLSTVIVGDKKILISRLEGKLYACVAKCPHAGFAMGQAEVDGTVLSCPLHGWRFDMRDAGSEVHGYRGVEMRAIKVDNGVVLVGE